MRFLSGSKKKIKSLRSSNKAILCIVMNTKGCLKQMYV